MNLNSTFMNIFGKKPEVAPKMDINFVNKTREITAKDAFEMCTLGQGHRLEYKRGLCWLSLSEHHTLRVFSQYSEWRLKYSNGDSRQEETS